MHRSAFDLHTGAPKAPRHPGEGAERALAHALPYKVEAASWRGAMSEKGRRLMEK